MRFGRAAAVAAAAALATGGCLLAGNSSGSAATPPPPTPISLGLSGMSSSACPLPLNGSMAVKPGTTVQFKPELPLGVLQQLTLSYVRETTTTPKPAATTKSVPNTGLNVAFPSAGSYDLSWHTDLLGALGGVIQVGASTTGKLLVDANAQQCVIAIQVPIPSVSVTAVPSPVTSLINGVLSSAASTVNGVLSPVNSAVGPIVSSVAGTVGGVIGSLPGGGSPGPGVPPTGSVPGTTYQPTGPTVAQRTVPQGYGNGNGAAGIYLPTTGGSVNAPAAGSTGTGTGTGTSKAGSATPIKAGGSPHTVDVAADKPTLALEGWSVLIVLAALIALSGATAFYARTFLLHPASTSSRVPTSRGAHAAG
ncbi:MAG TPA: hypothetical protein VJ851_11885 [Jatrophihabitans sp.]|nr:hypothetical protein [Jatrophihabitans sp.]